MKLIPLLVLGSAALGLGWIAWRSPAPTEMPTWVAASDGEVHVPLAIVGELGPGLVRRDFKIEGMCCRGCTKKLYAALLAVPEVERAAVNFESASASAVVPRELEVARLAQALSFDKYSATAAASMPVSPAGAEE